MLPSSLPPYLYKVLDCKPPADPEPGKRHCGYTYCFDYQSNKDLIGDKIDSIKSNGEASSLLDDENKSNDKLGDYPEKKDLKECKECEEKKESKEKEEAFQFLAQMINNVWFIIIFAVIALSMLSGLSLVYLEYHELLLSYKERTESI